MVSSPDALSIDFQVQRLADDTPVSFADSPGALHPGDKIFYSIRPETGSSWDVLLFHVDSQLGITALRKSGQSVRLSQGEKISKKIGTINDNTLGVESLVIIAEPVEDYGLESDYSFLTQPPHPGTTIKGLGSPFAKVMGEIWTDSGELSTKGLEEDELTPQIWFFTWTVEPIER